LYAWEIQEAHKVFSNALQYDRVRIHECTSLPNTINKIGTWLKGMPYTPTDNAITLGNHCYFPIQLSETPPQLDHPDHEKSCWLIHELTHIWQYQRMGWRYLFLALQAQFRLGAQAYQYGGEKGLFDGYQKGWTLSNFNLEQQGDITRDYYQRLCMGRDISAWLPFITEIQQNLT
jgi:type VI secretion system secreted protein VgrG